MKPIFQIPEKPQVADPRGCEGLGAKFPWGYSPDRSYRTLSISEFSIRICLSNLQSTRQCDGTGCVGILGGSVRALPAAAQPVDTNQPKIVHPRKTLTKAIQTTASQSR
jgi:hypothetical protein